MSKANYSPAPIDEFERVKAAPSAFTGATENSRGDQSGTSSPLTLFTVTGEVQVRIFGVCTTSLTSSGAANIEVGVTGNTASLIAQTTATDIDANDVWNDASPTVGVDTLANITGPHVIINGLDIIETISADVQTGQIYYICLWQALSPDGKVVSAV